MTSHGQQELEWAPLLPGSLELFPSPLSLPSSLSFLSGLETQGPISTPNPQAVQHSPGWGAPPSTFCLSDISITADPCGLTPRPAPQHCGPPGCHQNLVVFLLTPRPRDVLGPRLMPRSLCFSLNPAPEDSVRLSFSLLAASSIRSLEGPPTCCPSQGPFSPAPPACWEKQAQALVFVFVCF